MSHAELFRGPSLVPFAGAPHGYGFFLFALTPDGAAHGFEP
jgi:hypothetical protein